MSEIIKTKKAKTQQHKTAPNRQIYALPDRRSQLAMVVLKSGQTATADDIRQHIQRLVDAGEISKFAIPDQIRFVDELARTSVGKLNKRAMREQLG